MTNGQTAFLRIFLQTGSIFWSPSNISKKTFIILSVPFIKYLLSNNRGNEMFAMVSLNTSKHISPVYTKQVPLIIFGSLKKQQQQEQAYVSFNKEKGLRPEGIFNYAHFYCLLRLHESKLLRIQKRYEFIQKPYF